MASSAPKLVRIREKFLVNLVGIQIRSGQPGRRAAQKTRVKSVTTLTSMTTTPANQKDLCYRDDPRPYVERVRKRLRAMGDKLFFFHIASTTAPHFKVRSGFAVR